MVRLKKMIPLHNSTLKGQTVPGACESLDLKKEQKDQDTSESSSHY